MEGFRAGVGEKPKWLRSFLIKYKTFLWKMYIYQKKWHCKFYLSEEKYNQNSGLNLSSKIVIWK